MNIECKLGIHNWYSGCYITGYKSEYTGDHVGRSEVRCMDCNKRGIFLSQYSKDQQFKLEGMAKIFKRRKHRYIEYTPGDAVDKITKKWIADSGALPL